MFMPMLPLFMPMLLMVMFTAMLLLGDVKPAGGCWGTRQEEVCL
jgi:hypothetical protein